MADLDETLGGPASVDADAPIPDAIASETEITADDALEPGESDSPMADGGPAEPDSGDALEPSDTEREPVEDDEDRPASRKELGRKYAELEERMKSLLDERDRAQQAAKEAAEALERNAKTQEELEKDFFELVGTEDEYREADRLSRYSDDPYERESALQKYEQLSRMREKLPKAWLWYVGKMAGSDVQAFAAEAKLDAAKLIAAPSMAELLKTVRAESTAELEKQWKGKYDALEAKLNAEIKAHDATRAKVGGATPSPDRGGRAAKGFQPFTRAQLKAMSVDEYRRNKVEIERQFAEGLIQ